MGEHCGSCDAPVFWALTPSGARNPINREPTDDGNVLLLRHAALGVLAITLSKDALANARHRAIALRTSHWATCPDRRDWRERTDARRAS